MRNSILDTSLVRQIEISLLLGNQTEFMPVLVFRPAFAEIFSGEQCLDIGLIVALGNVMFCKKKLMQYTVLLLFFLVHKMSPATMRPPSLDRHTPLQKIKLYHAKKG